MNNTNLKDELKEKYNLTGMEVDDIMRYVKILCLEFERLARNFKSEHLIELNEHQIKSRKNKSEKNVLLKAGKGVFNLLSSPAKELKQQYSKTHKARDLVLTALDAHNLHGDHRTIITDILSLMSKHNQFQNDEMVITGRRAFESLHEAGIEG